MIEPNPMDYVVAAIGPKNLAMAFGEALERILDTAEGENAFCAWLERIAARNKAHQ